MIVTTAPGKLYIAGEYAVIEPGYSAILVAVDRFIKVTLGKANNEGSVSIYDSVPISWSRDNEGIIFDQRDNRLLYIKEVINIVETYAKDLGKQLSFYNIKVISELETNEGTKYGLGSSAAVTVATVEALCKYYEIELSREKLFKIAALANLSVNSNSSCGDIAAAVYGGWISYTTFDKEWVLAQRGNTPLSQLLNMNWAYLSIECLIAPKELELVVGWTGKPASTVRIVDNFKDRINDNSNIYNKFLHDSKSCVSKMIDAFKNKDIDEIQRQIQINRNLLVDLSKDLNLVIETPMLTKLCDIALGFNVYAKSSGAGGGDCGIAILKDTDNLFQLIDEWEKAGVKYLPLKVYEKEGDKID